jgi:hypothetical protein
MSGGTDLAQRAVDGPAADDALSELEREILEFERSWWKYAGAKDSAIREKWDISPTRYYQLLAAIIEKPAALEHDPMLVRRLVRLRDARRAQRSGQRAGTYS